MKDFTERALEKVAVIERILKEEYGAQGHSIGELIRSVDENIDSSLQAHIKNVAKTRNRLVHEGRKRAGIGNEHEFLAELDSIARKLRKSGQATLSEMCSGLWAFTKENWAVIGVFILWVWMIKGVELPGDIAVIVLVGIFWVWVRVRK